jgi:H+-transporting ATPase
MEHLVIPSSTHSQASDNSDPSAGPDLSTVVDDQRPVPAPDRQDPPTTAALPGLTTDEAERRLKTEGANAIADVRQRPLWMAARKLWAPVPWMLEVAIVLQLALKDYVGASIVLLLLLFNAGLGLFQESQAQATVDALRSTAPCCWTSRC